MRLSEQTIEYLKVPVAAIVNGTSSDPSGLPVAFAFTTSGQESPSSWVTGSWEALPAVDVETGATQAARCLIGTTTNGVKLTRGSFGVWIKVTDSPEIPIRRVGTLEIT